jgi:hypothetical protein
MITGFDAFAPRLAQVFAALTRRVEEQIWEQLLSAGDTLCNYCFEVDAQTLRGLVARLQEDAQLWTDVQNAVLAHRADRHWTMLVEFVYEITNLQGTLYYLEQGFSSLCPGDRWRLANRLNCLDGEIAIRHDLADRRNLAGRVNKAANFPMIDGLTMRGLTFVLAEHADLWREFRALVEPWLPGGAGR